jgi:hypothetical protein
MRQVTFYTRRRCCLCDDALAVVQAVQRRAPFSLSIVDIDKDPTLVEAYGHKVPVVMVDGRMHAKYRVDERWFLRRIAGPQEHA